MVDVSEKAPTTRTATAEGRIKMRPETLEAIKEGSAPKGDVLAAARVAGIMAAKKTSELIPLCHPLPLSYASVAFDIDHEKSLITATSEVRTTSNTGVEMEALTAVSVALLTIYDMAKAIERGMKIEGIRLLSKTGGVRGDYRAGGK